MSQIKLTNDLKAAVASGTPVELVDPSTNEVYYLVSAAQLQSLKTNDLDPRLLYPVIERVMAEDDANDPLLDSYQ